MKVSPFEQLWGTLLSVKSTLEIEFLFIRWIEQKSTLTDLLFSPKHPVIYSEDIRTVLLSFL